jgi:hypothetical protein
MRSATKDNPNSHEQAISFTVKNDTHFLMKVNILVVM